jgi:hypothetical protein
MLGGQSPLAISVGKPSDRNDTNARLVITTVARTKTNTPSCLQRLVVFDIKKENHPYLARLGLRNGILQSIHTLLGSNGIRTGQHLDESMSLILVDDARLNSTESSKDTPNLTF